MALKKLLFYFVLSIAGLLVASTVKSLLTDKLTHSTGYLIENKIIQNKMSSGFKLESFNDFIYIRDKKNNNVAVTKAKEYKLKPGKYSLATALGKLGKFRVRKNTFTEINASDYLQSVQFINISDKAYLYDSQKIKPYSPGLRNKKNTIAIHTLYADQGIDEVVFNNEVLQLPFGKFRLHIDGQYDNRNYFDFQVQKNTPQIIDFKNYFAYLNIPSDYKRGRIDGASKNGRYTKCCTVKPGRYSVIVDDQLVSEVETVAGKIYGIASKSTMVNVSVARDGNFKISGNDVTHDFSLGNAKLNINLIPNNYKLFYSSFNFSNKNRYEKYLTTLKLSEGQNITLDEEVYLGKLILLNKAKTKNIYFEFIEGKSNKLVNSINHLIDESFLPSGNYRLEINGKILSNFTIQIGETTSLDLKSIYGEVVLKNHNRSSYNLHHASSEKYIDQIHTHKRAEKTYLIPGNYCLRKRKNPNNGSIGAIIKCFDVTENETTVVDLSVIE